MYKEKAKPQGNVGNEVPRDFTEGPGTGLINHLQKHFSHKMHQSYQEP